MCVYTFQSIAAFPTFLAKYQFGWFNTYPQYCTVKRMNHGITMETWEVAKLSCHYCQVNLAASSSSQDRNTNLFLPAALPASTSHNFCEACVRVVVKMPLSSQHTQVLIWIERFGLSCECEQTPSDAKIHTLPALPLPGGWNGTQQLRMWLKGRLRTTSSETEQIHL